MGIEGEKRSALRPSPNICEPAEKREVRERVGRPPQRVLGAMRVDLGGVGMYVRAKLLRARSRLCRSKSESEIVDNFQYFLFCSIFEIYKIYMGNAHSKR